MEQISQELQYAPVVNNHSTLAFRKISPQGISTAIALSSAGSVGPTEFIIPPSVFNPAKSRLNFQIQLPAVATTPKVNWIDGNLSSAISRIVLYDSATNAVWLDCSNFEKYAALVGPAGTSYDEFKTKSTNWSATGPQLLPQTSAASQPYPSEDIQKCNSLFNYTHVGFTNGAASTSGFNSYEGRRYLLQGADIKATVCDVSLPLSAFKLTALALDKNLYCPANLVLQVYWNATDNYAWNSASTTDPSSSPISIVTGATTLINNVSLQLANEQNLSIVSKITQQVMSSGISIPIAYPTTTRQQIASSTAHSYQLNLTKGYGQRILALITAPFNTGEVLNQRNAHNRGTLTTYNTFMNNIATKYQAGYDCTLGQDYFYGNREYLENSAVQNLGEYVNTEWIHVDSYFGERPLHTVDQTVVDGYDVGMTASAWQIQATFSTPGTAATWITAIIGQKVLTLSSQGSMVA